MEDGIMERNGGIALWNRFKTLQVQDDLNFSVTTSVGACKAKFRIHLPIFRTYFS